LLNELKKDMEGRGKMVWVTTKKYKWWCKKWCRWWCKKWCRWWCGRWYRSGKAIFRTVSTLISIL